MYIYTENGFKQILPQDSSLLKPYTTPPAIVRAEREWRSAWNTGAQEFNVMLERAQTWYKRMLDVKPLQMIPADSTKIPS